MSRTVLLLALGAFAAGVGLARGAGSGATAEQVKELVGRQEALFTDLRRIETAARDILEIKKTRDAKELTLTDEELQMERKGASDLHIFMERFRNDTLEVLAFYEGALGRRQVDPLVALLGKSLDEVVKLDWHDRSLEDVLGDLQDAYKIRIGLRGELDSQLVITLYGEMSLRSILSQIEEVWGARFVVEEGQLVLAAQ